jgi:hypothetical protein
MLTTRPLGHRRCGHWHPGTPCAAALDLACAATAGGALQGCDLRPEARRARIAGGDGAPLDADRRPGGRSWRVAAARRFVSACSRVVGVSTAPAGATMPAPPFSPVPAMAAAATMGASIRLLDPSP